MMMEGGYVGGESGGWRFACSSRLRCCTGVSWRAKPSLFVSDHDLYARFFNPYLAFIEHDLHHHSTGGDERECVVYWYSIQ
jgi:hypothetical protein